MEHTTSIVSNCLHCYCCHSLSNSSPISLQYDYKNVVALCGHNLGAVCRCKIFFSSSSVQTGSGYDPAHQKRVSVTLSLGVKQLSLRMGFMYMFISL